MTGLTNAANEGSIHRILRPMVYKLFSTIVVYSEKYHGLQEVYMNCALNEIVANVKFQSSAECGKFTYSPYWIDTIAHLPGFVLNGNVSTPEDTVYISHGWKSLRIAAPLSDGKFYRGYAHMQPVGSRGLMCGDIYLFEGNDVVAVCFGLNFQEMKKTLLHALVKQSHKPSSQKVREEMRCSQTSIRNTASRRPRKVKRYLPLTALDATNPHPLFSKILYIIAREANLNLTELVESANFAELGVDSLLSISVNNWTSNCQPRCSQCIPRWLSLESTWTTNSETRL